MHMDHPGAAPAERLRPMHFDVDIEALRRSDRLDPGVRQRLRAGLDTLLRRVDIIPARTISRDPDNLAWFGDEAIHRATA